ncbi:MAG: valine--tRNA ligase [Candidatus Solincola sediminis]|uniref:Valine--tRNA ligase n=1 Tax=Candidatus Solincola sediminis TaxID=1797199 RepID=A0A1F2WQ44_9ACTN|nr:MAG: valine--tRNA ligase [Candidatus Solincola sediminis]
MADETSIEISKAYEPAEVEARWYRFWEEHKYFHAEVNPEKQPFCIVIPPPNVTGSLHLGHALNNSLQDFIIRRKRMQGYEALWLPGTDHAGIATHAVVERILAEEGTNRWEIGREAFLDRVWKWVEQYGGTIVRQLKSLGCSCDWDRLRFTMDEGCSKAVREVFVRLFEQGYIYQAYYIVNWCPYHLTAISDIEVEYEDVEGKLWYIRYDLKDSDEYFFVATTRPETMLGDTAIAVNPRDERYKDMVGKTAILPLLGREMPVIADDFVDPEFGTGIVKVTPAHDPNDFEIGKRHDLPEINILTPDAKINENGGPYAGLDRYEAREAVLADLEKISYIQKVEKREHAVGHCYRCHTVIEPYLSKQWFVRMKGLAEPAIRAVEDGRTDFVPERWKKIYFDWMYNIRDWCISRQLWWGHRIPAWYCNGCGEVMVAREAPERCTCGGELEQDQDVLDTWFSSGLWPMSTLGWPDDTPDLHYFYPTSVLVTAFDIIFFWVARMMMSGLHFKDDVPFQQVFVTALIRDEMGKKMSKSSGNVIDPLGVIDLYGADALRFTLGHIAVPGRDVFLSEERIAGSRHFCNKIWNAARFTLLNLEGFDPWELDESRLHYTLADTWILSTLNRLISEIDEDFEAYNFSEAAKALYEFFWSDFCDWYVELSKLRLYGEAEEDRATAQHVLWRVLEQSLRLLHPFMPFITEEIWQRLPRQGRSITVAPWPAAEPALVDLEAEERMNALRVIITALRRLRSELNLAPGIKVAAIIVPMSPERGSLIQEHRDYLISQARLSSLELVGSVEDPSGYARAIAAGVEVFLPLTGEDFREEVDRIRKEISRLDQEAARFEGKLANEQFITKAPPEIVEKERARLDDCMLKMEKLREQLELLSQDFTEGSSNSVEPQGPG